MMDSGFWVGSIKSRSLSTENVPGRCESGVYLCLQPRPPLRRRLSWWTLCCRPPATVKAMNCNGLLIRARTMVTDSGRFSNLDFSASNSSTSCLEIVWCPRLHRPRIWSLGPGCRRRRLRRLVWDIIYLTQYYDTSCPQRVVSRKVSRNGNEPETEIESDDNIYWSL